VAACSSTGARLEGLAAFELKAGERPLRVVVASTQNFDGFAVLLGAELEPAVVDADAAELFVSEPPPHAASRTTAAAAGSPVRQAVRVRRMPER
jgi:hypothetical protein